nr:hypothetical protein HmN_000145000 [Hymenolepis microstoma]
MNSQLFIIEIEYIKRKIIENVRTLSAYVMDLPISQNCQYKFEKSLGEGTYGEVFSAKRPDSTDIFVLKRFKDNSREYMLSTIRELCFLHRLRHENIVHLIEICCKIENTGNFSFGLVLEACVCNLEPFTDGDVETLYSHKKSIIQQIFQGLSFIHSNNILHRDLKPGNILVNPNGVIKIADFGLAQLYESRFHIYTPNVISPGYKPPETICSAIFYNAKVDIFSIGVVTAELFTTERLFQGETITDQAKEMTQFLGKLDSNSYPGCEYLHSYYRYFSNQEDEAPILVPYLKEKNVPEEAINLIVRLLQLYPADRPQASEVLEDSFFSSDPAPNGNFLQLIPRNKRLIGGD